MEVDFVIARVGGDVPAHVQSENMAIHTWHVQKWWKVSAIGWKFLCYNESIMRKVHEEVSGGPFSLSQDAPSCPDSFSQLTP